MLILTSVAQLTRGPMPASQSIGTQFEQCADDEEHESRSERNTSFSIDAVALADCFH